MPWALAAAAVSAGTALYSGSQQKKAANEELAARTAANDKSLAAQQAARDRVAELQAPFVQGGELANNALLQRLGLIQPGTTATQPDPYFGYNVAPDARGVGSTPMTAPQPAAYGDRAIEVPAGSLGNAKTGSAGTSPAIPDTGAGVTTAATPAAQGAQVPDWNAFAQANPDVAQWAASGHGDPNIPIDQQSIEQRYAYWLQNGAKLGDPRASQPLPMTTAQPAQTQQTAAGPERTDLMTADRPAAGAAPTYARPDQGTAPDASQYFSNFTADPGYQFRLDQGLRAANAGYAARGLLKSDAAVKGVNDYAQGQASQAYGDWFSRQGQLYNTALNQFNNNRSNANQNFENDRSYGTNMYLNNRDFTNNNFTSDRTYQTNRYDTNTGNLFSLARMGQASAGAVGGANESYANNAGNIFSSEANAASDASDRRAAANTSMVGSVAGSVSKLIGSYGGGSQPFSASTASQGWPTQQALYNPGQMTTFQPPVF